MNERERSRRERPAPRTAAESATDRSHDTDVERARELTDRSLRLIDAAMSEDSRAYLRALHQHEGQ